MKSRADKHKARQEMTRAGSRRLWPYLRRHLGFYFSGALTLVLTNLFVTVLPYLFSKMVEELQAEPIEFSRLRFLLLVAFAVALGGALTRVASRLLIFNTGRHIEYELRTSLFAHMQKLKAAVFARRATGDLISRATNDLSSVRLLFGFGMLHVMNTPLLFLMAIVMMSYINPRLTPAVLAVYPVVVLGVRRYSRNMFELTQEVQGTLGEISAVAQENFSAAQVVKSYTLEDHEIEKMRHLSQRYLSRSVKLALTRNVLFNTMTMVIGLSELVLLGFGGWEIIHGRLTMGELVAFNVYLGMMVWPTMAFGFILSVWQRGMAAMSRIEEILAEPEEPDTLIQVMGRPWERSGFWQEDIRVQGLSWGYPVPADSTNGHERVEVLKDVSIRVAGSKVTALIGTTGCGKSTLARLLTRLNNPPAGTITIGGLDLTAIPLDRVRSNLGLAEQESFLFSRTLAENIGFGRPKVTHEEIVRAARN
ncbi:MAG: ABC transporter ATP-binding protein, partial [Thermodesulfobacteriota bacterium]